MNKLFVGSWDKLSNKLVEEIGDQVEVVDVDEDDDIAEKFAITQVPTLFIVKSGEKLIKPTLDTVLQVLNIQKEEKKSAHKVKHVEQAEKIILDEPLRMKRQKTRIKMANLCCEMESKLIHKCLDPLEGVLDVRVSVIGRLAIVTHDACISGSSIVDELNKAHLGAALSGTNIEDVKERDEHFLINKKEWLPPLLIVIIYFLGIFSRKNWFCVIAIFFGILPIARGAWRALSWYHFDVNVLMLVALTGALLIGQYHEAGGIVLSFTLANCIQDACLRYVRRELEEAVAHSSDGLSVDTVTKMNHKSEEITLPLKQIQIGDIIAVRPGERIMVDGIVQSGVAACDYAVLTGESIPITLEKDQKCFAGGLVLNGYLRIKTLALATYTQGLQDMVQDAQASSSSSQLLVNTIAAVLTKVALLLALALIVLGFILKNIYFWTNHALILLVVACPCALVLASPIATASALVAAAKRQVLIKSATTLEALATIDTVALDKTGTLTQGHCRVIQIHSLSSNNNKKEILRLAASLETRSAHPLAAAIINEATGCVSQYALEYLSDNVREFRVEAGGGISGFVDDRLVAIGNANFCQVRSDQFESIPSASIFIAIDDEPQLALQILDPLRPEAMDAVRCFRNLNLDLAILTGDQHQPAIEIANSLHISQVLAGLKPESKLQWVREVQEEKKHSVLMVGDGINDAPALSLAKVGAAMAASGTVLALQAADLGILSDDLRRLPESIELSRFCKSIIGQNITIALFLKVFIIFVAALAAGQPRLWQAILADAISLVLVLFNGIRPLAFFSSSSLFSTKVLSSSSTSTSSSYSALHSTTTSDGEYVDIENRATSVFDFE